MRRGEGNRRRGPVDRPRRPVATVDRWFPAITRRSAITFAVLVVLLLVPWPRLGRVFAVLFSGYANAVVVVTGAGGAHEPRFSAQPPAGAPPAGGEEGGDWAVWLSATSAGESGPAAAPLDTRIIGYTPLALFAALTLATAVPRRRRLAILGMGGGLLLARLAVAIALPTARAFGGSGLAFGPFAETIWFVLIDLPAMSYVAPLFAWWLGLGLTSPSR
jgi:hypothetical protein